MLHLKFFFMLGIQCFLDPKFFHSAVQRTDDKNIWSEENEARSVSKEFVSRWNIMLQLNAFILE